MMKRHISALTVVILVVLLAVPASLSAQDVTRRQEVFCDLQAGRQNAVIRALDDRAQAYEQALSVQSERQADRRNRQDEALAAARARADLKRSESYRLIKEKQDTEAGRELADAYAAEVDAAVFARRGVYDTARAAFHKTVDDLLAARDRGVRMAADLLRSSASAAMDQATRQCGSNRADRAIVRQELVAELRSARLAYAESLRNRQDFRAGVRAAVSVRDDAYRTATAAFQRVMQSIRGKYEGL